jgi:homocysteine S-methyltransferase
MMGSSSHTKTAPGNRFRELLADGRPHLFDGAMGTELYARGVLPHRCFDELNLSGPNLVIAIHRDYVKAGAEILETNTYGANRVKLAVFGLEGRVGEINQRGVDLARKAAGEAALVAGAIGPLGVRVEPFGPTALEEAREIFVEQAAALAEAGADVIVLETFGCQSEMVQAILGVKAVCDLPVVAQMTVDQELRTTYGNAPEQFVPHLVEAGADVLGLNCSIGPATMFRALDHLLPLTDRKISIQPNAGLPREVQGRKTYTAPADYMAKYAGRLIRKGVSFVGGCCGTTPAHTQRMSDAVRSLAPGRRARVQVPHSPKVQTPPVPLAERSAWGRKIAQGEQVASVEIVPPRGVDPEEMLDQVRQLRDAGVDAVNVPDGPRAQMRMGVLATSSLIDRVKGIESVAHYTCRDRNLLGMLSDLLGAHALGIRNLLLVTGDPPKMGPYPEATAVFDIDSIGLTNLVRRLNHGVDPGENPIGEPTRFVIGVGANPGSVDLEFELQRFYWKVDAGAEYAITQPVFDVEQLWDFLRELDARQLGIPIVAGLWPLVSLRNAEFLANEVPGIHVPKRVIDRMRRATEKSREHGIQEGIQIARETWCQIRSEVQGIQVSAPFGRVDLALAVFKGELPGDLHARGAEKAASG